MKTIHFKQYHINIKYIPYLLVAGPPKQTATPAFCEGLPTGECFFSLLKPGSDGDCVFFLLILCSLIKREHLQKSHSQTSTQKMFNDHNQKKKKRKRKVKLLVATYTVGLI